MRDSQSLLYGLSFPLSSHLPHLYDVTGIKSGAKVVQIGLRRYNLIIFFFIIRRKLSINTRRKITISNVLEQKRSQIFKINYLLARQLLMISWLFNLSVQTFQPLIVQGNFVY